MVLRVDEKGRILIPSKIRRKLNIRNLVKIVVGEGEITLRPVEDPLSRFKGLVVKGTRDVEKEIRYLRSAAEKELEREV
ncbi:AbrB/MazE/SpoVT family DNA-binding domain-containing protein [Candidatus Bathyarchaeota archaeon]|nr:AbrB/MazE/SpoVT family DNA-binding domain-containing protein [Candidatus Bathyarchaeota archaeon]